MLEAGHVRKALGVEVASQPLGQHARPAGFDDSEGAPIVVLLDQHAGVLLIKRNEPREKRDAVVTVEEVRPRPVDDLQTALKLQVGLAETLLLRMDGAEQTVQSPKNVRIGVVGAD